MPGLLIENGHVLTTDNDIMTLAPGWVLIKGDRIAAVGPGSAPANLVSGTDRVIDATRMAVTPGLINGHTHLSQTYMRGLGDDKPLLDWLQKMMWPIQAAMSPKEMYLASLLGLLENLRCGVTGVVQHHKLTTTEAHIDAAARAAGEVGLRLLLARGWVDLGEAGEAPEKILESMGRLRERWHQSAGGRITVGFGPMAAWRCSDDLMRHTVALAREWGLVTHVHIAEAGPEIELMRQRNGLRHVEWLDSLGVLGPDLQLVHCVHVDDREVDLIAASGASVIHCPVSNMYLASGAAPIRKMLDRGISVALGTDGPASHNSQDLLETMKIAALLAKVSTGDATALLPVDVLRMVTSTGARLFGQADLGRLSPGAKADLTLVNLNTARAMPVHRPESALVYNASGPDVHTVIVEGRILLDAGRVVVLDEEALLAECRSAARQLLSRAGVA